MNKLNNFNTVEQRKKRPKNRSFLEKAALLNDKKHGG